MPERAARIGWGRDSHELVRPPDASAATSRSEHAAGHLLSRSAIGAGVEGLDGNKAGPEGRAGSMLRAPTERGRGGARAAGPTSPVGRPKGRFSEAGSFEVIGAAQRP